MALHQASGRWRRGLLLALATAACWASLPAALELTLEQLDPYTLTWVRFFVAAGVLGAWLGARGGLSGFALLDRRRWVLLIVAALFLISNYVLYVIGLQRTSPGNAQLLIQLAPLLMAMGGVFVFREPYRFGQWCGLAIIATGLILFFRDQSQGVSVASNIKVYWLGSGVIVVAAAVWAAYALIQKQLLTVLSAPAILLFIYVLASIMLLPLAHPAAVFKLDLKHGLLLTYCVLNTLLAYGAFAEALVHWEASRVSAILATTPLLCLGFLAFLHALWPDQIAAEQVTALGYLGACLVAVGSSMSSLLGNRRPSDLTQK